MRSGDGHVGKGLGLDAVQGYTNPLSNNAVPTGAVPTGAAHPMVGARPCALKSRR